MAAVTLPSLQMRKLLKRAEVKSPPQLNSWAAWFQRQELTEALSFLMSVLEFFH